MKDSEIALEEWDPLLRDLVTFVEEVRGQQFTRVAELGFVELPGGITSARPSVRSEHTDDLYRALGLASNEFDVIAERAKLFDDPDAVGAFYDLATGKIGVGSPGGERPQILDVVHQPIVVHELGHALQEQTGRATIGIVEGGTLALSLAEGEANWLYGEYVATFDEAEFSQWRAEMSALRDDVPDMPEIVVAERDHPYTLGRAFFSARFALGGIEAIDAVFDELPGSLREILDPFGEAVSPESLPVAPPDPGLRGENPQVAMGTVAELSAFRVYHMLAAAMPADVALLAARATVGHGGALSWLEEDRFCTAGSIAVLPQGRDLVSGALMVWAEGLPAFRSAVALDHGFVIEACDPGAGMVPAPMVDAIEALRRAEFLIDGETRAVELALRPAVGFCAAGALLESRTERLPFDGSAQLQTLEPAEFPPHCLGS